MTSWELVGQYWAWILLIGSVALALIYEFVAIAKKWLTITQLVRRGTAKTGIWIPLGFIIGSVVLFWHFFLDID